MITRGDIKNQAMLEPSLHKRGGKRGFRLYVASVDINRNLTERKVIMNFVVNVVAV